MTAPAVQTSATPDEFMSQAEAHLGRALALIHRVLPRLDDVERADEVSRVLGRAAKELQDAQSEHRKRIDTLKPAPVEGDVLALIAAAVAAVLDGPYRVLDVRRVVPAVTWVNAWAMEGRFQHYSSHKVR